jgi:uncharacterized protein with PQ loop repeat
MNPNAAPAAVHPSGPDAGLRRLLGAMSVFTMLMTIPQVLTIWIGQQAAGVSILSWSAYLVSAILWFWFGMQQKDKNIYWPCVGWIVLDVAVIMGVIIYG